MIGVGTIHFDIEGPTRLKHLLDTFQPKTITIEAPYTVSLDELADHICKLRVARLALLKTTDIPTVIKDYIHDLITIMGYDLVVPINYARKNSALIYGIDHPNIIPAGEISSIPDQEPFFKELKDVFEISLSSLSIDFSKIRYKDLKLVFVEQMDRGYINPKIWDKIQQLLKPLTQQRLEASLGYMREKEFAEDREQTMTAQIQKRNPDVHIGGLDHLFDFNHVVIPLYQLLGDLVTQRIRLCDAFDY